MSCMEVRGTSKPQVYSLTVNNASTAAQAVAAFVAKYPDAIPESVDDVIIVGLCLECQAPIMETDTDYTYDPESGYYWCRACKKKMKGDR
jgi:hypothetical protein